MDSELDAGAGWFPFVQRGSNKAQLSEAVASAEMLDDGSEVGVANFGEGSFDGPLFLDIHKGVDVGQFACFDCLRQVAFNRRGREATRCGDTRNGFAFLI